LQNERSFGRADCEMPEARALKARPGLGTERGEHGMALAALRCYPLRSYPQS
jgi:hypothetical protein